MKYPGWANVVCFSKGIGNALAQVIDPDGGANTFGRNAVRWKEDAGGVVQGYAASFPLTAGGLELFAEFNGDGESHYPKLTAAGVTVEQIEAARQVVVMEYGTRAEYEGGLSRFIDECGLALVDQR